MQTDIVIPNVDLEILKLQHMDLIEMLWDRPDDILWGLVEMLDFILDNYYENTIDEDAAQLLDLPHNDTEGEL